MNVEEIRQYALAKELAEESFPFGEDTLVFKVNNKMFLLLSLNAEQLTFNAKCDPEKAIELREEYPDNVLPGYHMNKKHWNSIVVNGLKDNLIKQFIDESYALVSKRK